MATRTTFIKFFGISNLEEVKKLEMKVIKMRSAKITQESSDAVELEKNILIELKNNT